MSQIQLELCTCQLNKLHYIKAICLSKLINPIDVKVKKPNENHAGLLKLHLCYSDVSHWLHLIQQPTEVSQLLESALL